MQRRLFFLAGLGLAASIAQAQLLLPPAARPDALMKAITSEVIAILKQDLASGERTDVARLVEEKILPLFDSYRETFAAAVRDGGIDGLIKVLADKNRQAARGLKSDRPGSPEAAGRTPS